MSWWAPFAHTGSLFQPQPSSGTSHLTFYQFWNRFPLFEASPSHTLRSFPRAWQLVISLSGPQRAGNDLLFWDNVKYNVPLHSWKASCPDKLIAGGNSRRQIHEYLPNRDVHQRTVMQVYSSEMRGGNPPEKTRTSLRADSRKLTSAYSTQAGRLHVKKSTSACMRGSADREVKPEQWRKVSASLPLEGAAGQTPTGAAKIHSLKISSSILRMKTAADRRNHSLSVLTPTDTSEESGSTEARLQHWHKQDPILVIDHSRAELLETMSQPKTHK